MSLQTRLGKAPPPARRILASLSFRFSASVSLRERVTLLPEALQNQAGERLGPDFRRVPLTAPRAGR